MNDPVDLSIFPPFASLFPHCTDYTNQWHLTFHSCLAPKCLGSLQTYWSPYLGYLSLALTWLDPFIQNSAQMSSPPPFLATHSERVHDTATLLSQPKWQILPPAPTF